MRAKEFLYESSQYVTRIDSQPIPDFSKNMQTYYHTDDFSQSGQFAPGSKIPKKYTGKITGVYAGDPVFTALYATGNANQTRYVAKYGPGQPIVYFDRKDIPAMRARRTYLTVFDGQRFKKLPTGEYFSDNPGQPVKQETITDPFQYIKNQGWEFKIVDDLPAVLKKLQAQQVRYGAEGMDSLNELNYPDELNVSDALQQYFVRRGYQVAGEGRDQIAFESPRGTVVKVLGIGEQEREEVVKRYVKFFVENQNNPYYPRIYNTGNFTVGNETYFVYEQEYLNYVSNEEEVLEYIEDLMSALPRGEQALQAFYQNRNRPQSISPEELAGLVKATYDLEKNIGGQAPLDLSMIENIRRRANGHLVIMDPYSL
jgi:hypothetical protein